MLGIKFYFPIFLDCNDKRVRGNWLIADTSQANALAKAKQHYRDATPAIRAYLAPQHTWCLLDVEEAKWKWDNGILYL